MTPPKHALLPVTIRMPAHRCRLDVVDGWCHAGASRGKLLLVGGGGPRWSLSGYAPGGAPHASRLKGSIGRGFRSGPAWIRTALQIGHFLRTRGAPVGARCARERSFLTRLRASGAGRSGTYRP